MHVTQRPAQPPTWTPPLQVWWDTAPSSLRATLWMLLADLPPDLPLLLLATADVPADGEPWQRPAVFAALTRCMRRCDNAQLLTQITIAGFPQGQAPGPGLKRGHLVATPHASPLHHTYPLPPPAELDPAVQQLFNVNAGGAYAVEPPSHPQRVAFFRQVAAALALPPAPGVDCADQRAPPRPLPVLPRAPADVAAEEEARRRKAEAAACQRCVCKWGKGPGPAQDPSWLAKCTARS